jgi:hypothetical protein
MVLYAISIVLSRSHRWVAALAFCALLSAHAAAARAPEPWVELRFATGMSEGRAAGIRSAVEAQLIDLAQTEPSEPSARSSPACIVSIDEAEQGLVLRFSDAAGQPLAPPRSIASDSDELAATETASIVRAFLIAQSESERTAPAKVAPHDSPELPAASVEATASEAWRGWLSAAYSGCNYAPELRWQNGLAFELAFALGAWLHAGVRYGFYPAAEIGNELAVVTLTRHDAGALLGIGARWGAFAGAVELGGGVSDTLRSTEVRTRRLVALDDSALLSGSAWLRLRGRFHVPGIARLAVDVAPAVELVSGAHPLVIREESEARLLTPNLVRLRCDLGIALDVL